MHCKVGLKPDISAVRDLPRNPATWENPAQAVEGEKESRLFH